MESDPVIIQGLLLTWLAITVCFVSTLYTTPNGEYCSFLNVSDR